MSRRNKERSFFEMTRIGCQVKEMPRVCRKNEIVVIMKEIYVRNDVS